MTNNSEQQNKDRVLKSLAIAGFVGLLIAIAWVGVQLVGVLPNAFGSLASIADVVYHPQPVTLTVASNKTIINSEESTTISWNVPSVPGSFAFSYGCAEGLSVDMRDAVGSIKSLTCGTAYNVGNVSSIDVIPTTAKTRFTDFKYQVDYIPTGKTEPTTSGNGGLTVTNPTIGTTPVTPAATTTPEATTTTPVVKPTTPATTTPITPTKPVVKAPVQVEHYTYASLVSNPNGFVDVTAKFVGVGTLEGSYFRNAGVIDNDAQGALQFEIKNYGTKTADAWYYVINLPNGTTYTSPAQLSLRPNERAIITIGFSAANMTGAKPYTVSAIVAGDTNVKNNSYTASVAITE